MTQQPLYFESDQDEMCAPLSYFKAIMKIEGIHEMTLHKAKREDVPGYFWCREFESIGEISEGGCGNQCPGYTPKNGKSGCCRHYSLKFYEPTDETITIRK